MSDNPITSVPEPVGHPINYEARDDSDDEDINAPFHPGEAPSPIFPTKLLLDFRGTRVDIDRETLVALPESILIVMFPNGLILGRQHADDELYEDEDAASDESMPDENQVIYVDFDPVCLDYILSFYDKAKEAFALGGPPPAPPGVSPLTQNPLLTKQAIIVLREELEFFAIPPKQQRKASNASQSESAPNGTIKTISQGINYSTDMHALKSECGQHLLKEDQIFTALQRNINKENNLAEQHLIDMLCVSGFSRDDKWGYRALEPMRTSIVSIALVMLKTTGQANQMATAQKLLLFWRKPARKCWWDGVQVFVGADGDIPVRLWARRTWTLELALV
ncbi:hypothetical protein BZG36_04174 [Bifiguratus adelaidae]|uniref:Phosphatase activator n=1 Tax=Bifiguratus adelaidae TaxID=1938954 RepID=A0A261XYU9_9FUNG|nr:hypothetical protein BZG36_04174 [Bifiguratus adelaidae]